MLMTVASLAWPTLDFRTGVFVAANDDEDLYFEVGLAFLYS